MEQSYESSDLNNVRPASWVNWRFIKSASFISSATNRPDVNAGVVFCFGVDANNYSQVAVGIGARLFVRHCNYGTWTSWVEK